MRRLMVFALAAGLAGSGAGADGVAVTTGAADVRAAFVAVPPGARAAGMGEAYTAVADDPSAVLWNPAGLAGIRTLSAAASWDAAGAGIGLGHLGVAVPAGALVLGGSLTVLSFGSYDIRGDDGVKAGTAAITDYAAAVGGAAAMPAVLGGRGSLGVSAEFVSESGNGTLVGFGLGVMLPVGPVAAAASLSHLGPSRDGFGLPGEFRVGATVAMGTRTLVAADLGWGLADRQPVLAAGAEIRLHRFAVARAGYRFRPGAVAPAGLNGIAAGAGARVASWGLDYAFQPHGDLAMSHRVSLSWSHPRGPR